MTNEVFSAILEQMTATLQKGEFKQIEDFVYKNEKLAFKISHDESRKLLILDIASIDQEGNIGEYATQSSWLFEEAENLRDAASAGMDFNDTLKNFMGVRKVRTARSGEVALPDKNAGDAKNVEALCGKLLAIYPQLKDAYKEHVETYGSFLYVDFFAKKVAPQVGEALDQNNKKAMKKLFDCLAEMYNLGDRAAQNAVLGVVLGGAVRGNEKRYETALSYLEEHTFLKTAFINIMPKVNKDKRFKEIFS